MIVKADVAPNLLADDKTSQLRGWIKTANLDERIDVDFKGENEEQNNARHFWVRPLVWLYSLWR